MTVSDGEWKKITGVGDFPAVKDYYEFSHRGLVRSLDHTTNGRFYEGVDPLKLRPDPDDYLVVNITLADGTRKNGVSVARLVLLAHDPDGYAPGLEACHGDGGKKDNRWPENIRWDTPGVNREEALTARRANRPARTCPRCGREHRDPGQRCHRCVVEIGQQAAGYLAEGTDLERAAEALEYPSPIGLLRLARKHGGLRMRVDPAAVTVSDKPARQPWLRRVINRAGVSPRNSDVR